MMIRKNVTRSARERRHDVPCGETVGLEIPRPIIRVEFFQALTSFKATILRSIPTRHYFSLGMQFESALI
jgi:hypothetical protein